MRGILQATYIIATVNLLLLLSLEGDPGAEEASSELCKSAAWLHLQVAAEMTLGLVAGSAQLKAEQESLQPCTEDLSTESKSPLFYDFSFQK